MKNILGPLGRVCFIGAALGALALLFLDPANRWWALIIAAIVGYLSYNFRDVLAAIPEAWSAVRESASSERGKANIRFLWASPIAHIAMLMYVAISFTSGAWQHWAMMICVYSWVSYMAAILFLMVLGFFAALTAPQEFQRRYERAWGEGKSSVMEATMNFTHGDVVWIIWRNIIAPITLTVLAVRFLWALFNVIHCNRRVLCAFASTAGLVIGYLLWFRPEAEGFSKGLFILMTGAAGYLVGNVSWFVVSKAWLHIDNIPIEDLWRAKFPEYYTE